MTLLREHSRGLPASGRRTATHSYRSQSEPFGLVSDGSCSGTGCESLRTGECVTSNSLTYLGQGTRSGCGMETNFDARPCLKTGLWSESLIWLRPSRVPGRSEACLN